jgi:hypothetical protein
MYKLFLLLLLTSCVTTDARDWGPWQMDDVQSSERVWRICKEELDGAELHNKGFCYQSEECRTRTTIFGNEKKECRRYSLICMWGDVDCLVKFGINNMTISNKK